MIFRDDQSPESFWRVLYSTELRVIGSSWREFCVGTIRASRLTTISFGHFPGHCIELHLWFGPGGDKLRLMKKDDGARGGGIFQAE